MKINIIKDYMFVIRTMRKLKIKRIKDPNNQYRSKLDIYVRDLVFSYYVDGILINVNGVDQFDAVKNIHNLKLLLERKKAFQEVKYDKEYESISVLDTYNPCH